MSAAKGCTFAALLLAVACGGAETVSKSQDTRNGAAKLITGGGSQLLWQSEHDDYPCSDPCGISGGCNCIGANNCPAGALNGSACSSPGFTCQAPVDGSHFTDVVCESVTVSNPPPPQPTWHVTSHSSCADCPRGTCASCNLATCSIFSQGQACSPAGATCVAISGSQFSNMTCE